MRVTVRNQPIILAPFWVPKIGNDMWNLFGDTFCQNIADAARVFVLPRASKDEVNCAHSVTIMTRSEVVLLPKKE